MMTNNLINNVDDDGRVAQWWSAQSKFVGWQIKIYSQDLMHFMWKNDLANSPLAIGIFIIEP